MKTTRQGWAAVLLASVAFPLWLTSASLAQTPTYNDTGYIPPAPGPTDPYPSPTEPPLPPTTEPPPPFPPPTLPPPTPLPGDPVRLCAKMVQQWEPGLSELAALEPTWSGTFDLDGSPSWALSIDLGPDACHVQVAPSIDPEMPYQQYLDWDGSLSTSGMLNLSIFEPGVYAVTATFLDPATPPRTYMIYAGAKKSNAACEPNVLRTVLFRVPNRDLYLLNSTSPDGFLDCAADVLPWYEEVDSALDVYATIGFAALFYDRPISVFAVAHGNISEQFTAPGFTLYNNNNAVQAMTANFPNGLRGVISTYETFSCCTGAQLNNPPNGGPHLLDALATGLTTPNLRAWAGGWDQIVWCFTEGRRGPELHTTFGSRLIWQ